MPPIPPGHRAGRCVRHGRPTPPPAALWALLLAAPLLGLGCSPVADDAPRQAVPGRDGATKTPAVERATRRAYDGAPPVIPHRPFGAACLSCHTEQGMAVAEVGFAPPSPHAVTAGLSLHSRCQQCHVFRQSEGLFKSSSFRGLAQDLRRGQRFATGAPPVLPHSVFMRENCLACHSGPAAREEIRTSHPERRRCQQCHVAQHTTTAFVASFPLPVNAGS